MPMMRAAVRVSFRRSINAAMPHRLGVVLICLLTNHFFRWPGISKKWPNVKGAGKWSEFSSNALNQTGTSDELLFRATSETLPDGFHLLVGKDISDLGQFATEIYGALAFAILLIFVLAAVASVSVTRRTVGRIESINVASRAIMESGLGSRIPLRGTQDEWDQLAQNLNSMLERIEILMAEVKQVSDNVAHDLRTPLARIRGRLEKASSERGAADRFQSLISETLADLDDVLRMFSSLTRISQIEAANQTAGFRMVNLGQIASEVAELFDAAAEGKGGRVDVVGDKVVLISVDRDLMFDALSNLVDNAIKHGREGGLVSIDLGQQNGETILSVSDDGPGIPSGEFEHVFKRFYRLERSRNMPGNGLGLSLVSAVARLHGANIRLIDNAPGLSVQLRFPRTDSASEMTYRRSAASAA
jgi:signal transduction histidine kinase